MGLWARCAICALQILAVTLGSQAVLADELTGILEVEITGLKDATGNIYIAVYDSDANWLSDETVLSKKVVITEARDGDVVRTELHLPLGDYAISAFHDKNDDGELDTNWVGQPEEPTAISNNALGKFGPPSFADAVFTLGAEPIVKRMDMREE